VETRVLKEMIDVVRTEENRRRQERADMYPEVAHDYLISTDRAFVAELCLMLLVALRHLVEKEMILLAARLAEDTGEISTEEYRKNVEKERKLLKERDGWKRIYIRLQITTGKEIQILEVLQELSNSYKHNPFAKPDTKLLKLLNLCLEWPKEKTVTRNVSEVSSPKKKNYATMSESGELWRRLGNLVELDDAELCDITERFVERVGEFMNNLISRTKTRPFKREFASLNPQDFEY
jgi:hypothetical protein